MIIFRTCILEPILVTILKEIRYYVLDICNDKFLICAMVNKNIIIIFNFNTKNIKRKRDISASGKHTAKRSG